MPGCKEHRTHFESQARGETTYLVAAEAEAEDGLAGHVLIRWRGSVHDRINRRFPGMAEIGRLMVAEPFRRAGVGCRLLETAEVLAADRGFEMVGLAVATDNLDARRLYERAGFVSAGTPPFISRYGLDSCGRPREQEVSYMVKSLEIAKSA